MTLRDIVARVNEWAQWRVRLDSSGLGYPSQTAEARAQTGQASRAGPIVPNIPMNRWAVEVDRAMRQMPADMRLLLEHKHLSTGGTMLELARAYAMSRHISLATYYRIEKDAYWFIGGFLSTQHRAAG